MTLIQHHDRGRKAFGVVMGVSLGGFDGFMPHQLLNAVKVNCVLHKACSKGISKAMKFNINYSVKYSSSKAFTFLAIERQAVRPGESMPIRLTKP